jgi:hypothetical protein
MVDAGAIRELPKPVDMADVIQALFRLPAQQRIQAYDFILFLQGRYEGPVDESDLWTDADLEDLRDASLQYIQATVLADESDAT